MSPPSIYELSTHRPYLPSPSGTDSSMASSSISLTDTSFSVSSSFCREGDCNSPQDKKDVSRKKKKKKKREDLEVVDGPKKDNKQSKKAGTGSRWRSHGMHEACCRCAGAFAADCTAVCCCPFAIFPVLAFILVELPSALASKMLSHFKVKRLYAKSSLQPTCSSNNGNCSATNLYASRSFKESHDNMDGEVHIIRFDTQNLLKHFEAENVGFGCLSQKRE